jgi:hypothetical protein
MSTETKWTPGPWVVDGGSPSLIWAEGRERRRLGGLLVQGLLVADLAPRTVNNVPPIDERRANARLIAAAPKMYEALRAAEWSGPRAFAHANSGPTCPWCRQPKPPRNHLGSGHASDCAWVAALAAADGREMP